jgi:catechol 2,3-dioxygenase-like lactoylglutathione lyase family enzyme
MNLPSYVLLYVAEPQKSADFYHRLLGAPVVERADTFCLLVLPSGLKLGLWARAEVDPHAPPAGSFELAATVDTREQVAAVGAEVRALGARVLEEPKEYDFGYALLFADPDGHRWRVFHRAD